MRIYIYIYMYIYVCITGLPHRLLGRLEAHRLRAVRQRGRGERHTILYYTILD